MGIGVFNKKLAETYFTSSGGNLQRTPNLFSGTDWFLIDPTFLQSNGGGPNVVSDTSTINSLRRSTPTLAASLSNCTKSAWIANGWSTEELLLFQLSQWVSNNFNNQALNINLTSMNLLYSEVTLGGTDYIIACCYFGNYGDLSLIDGGLFTTSNYLYLLDGNAVPPVVPPVNSPPVITLFQASKTNELDNYWATSSFEEATQWQDIAWSPQLNLFVAVGQFPSITGRYVATSPNGFTWTSRTAPASTWNTVTWSPELNLFVAIGASGLNRVMRSSDGINWTASSAASFNSWESVIWVPELSLFVAVGDGANPRVMTSPNGITWTSRTAPTNSWTSVTWSPSLNLLVAGGFGGAIMTSPDGINWTSRTSGSPYNISSIAWSPQLNLFAAVSTNGSSTPIITSPDGINWTTRSSPVSYSGDSIVWASGANRFISVGSSSGRHLVSSDGINWSQPLSGPISNSWRSVAWSPQLMRAVAVSSDGTNRATTLSSSQQLNFTVSSSDSSSSNLVLRFYSLAASYSSVQDIETNGTLLDTETVSNPTSNFANSISSSTAAYIFAVTAEDDAGGKGFAIALDTAAPTVVDDTVTISNVTSSSYDISWNEAVDNMTPSSSLEYYCSVQNPFTFHTVVALDWTANVLSATASGLNPSTNYVALVKVRDAAGNIFNYSPNDATTLPPEE